MAMISFPEWFPPAAVGVTFSALGGLKVWGLRRGIAGGAHRPPLQRLCGT